MIVSKSSRHKRKGNNMARPKCGVYPIELFIQNLEDDSRGVLDQALEIGGKLKNNRLELAVDNDGIGSYEFWGFRGYDKGHTWAYLEDSDSFHFLLVSLEAFPKGTTTDDVIKYLKKLFDDYSHRTPTIGSDEMSDGLECEIHLDYKNAVIGIKTFICDLVWSDE